MKFGRAFVILAGLSLAGCVPPEVRRELRQLNEATVALRAETASLQQNLAVASPRGSILALDADLCPAGWADFESAEGRVLLGIGNSDGANRDEMGNTLTSYTRGQTGGAGSRVIDISRATRLTVGSMLHIHGNANGWTGRIIVNDPTSGATPVVGAPSSFMPPFVAVKYCVKS